MPGSYTPVPSTAEFSADGRTLVAATAATQAEMEAGAEAALKPMSPLLIRQAIDARLAEGIDIDGGQL